MALSTRMKLTDSTPSSQSEINNTFSSATWMHTLPEQLKLSELCLPGTHDSITKMSANNDFSPENPLPPWLIKLGRKIPWFGKLIKKPMVAWSQAQVLTAGEQLSKGVRYFDLRVAFNATVNDFYTCHGLYSTDTLQQTLTEIDQFLSTNKSEIVLLDFRAFFQMDNAKHLQLVTMITNTFKNKITSPALGIDVTLKKMRQSNSQIVIFYHDNATVQAHPTLLWPSHYILSPWPNKTTPDTLRLALDNEINQHIADDRFFVIQGVLTPDTSMIVKGIFLGWLPGAKKWAPRSLEDLADLTNPALIQWLQTDWTQKKPKIVILDRIDKFSDQLFQAAYHQDTLLAPKQSSTTSAALKQLKLMPDNSLTKKRSSALASSLDSSPQHDASMRESEISFTEDESINSVTREEMQPLRIR